ncbi:MAG: tyrosine-protein phosphatase [Ilumatobacteraceae bacterium]
MSTSAATRWNHDGGIHEIPLPGVPGRLWLCGKHVAGPDPEALLARTGADLVVCLTERHELIDRYPGYVTWLDEHHMHRERAIWFPIHDLHAPPLAEGRSLVDEIVTLLRHGRGVVVHCAAGIGRAGTTAVATLVMLGMSPETALAHVRAHRPMAGPEVGAQQEFVAQIFASAQQVAGDVEPQLGGQAQ